MRGSAKGAFCVHAPGLWETDESPNPIKIWSRYPRGSFSELDYETVAGVRAAWSQLMRRNSEVGPWIDKVRLVGYTEPPRRVGQPEAVELPAVA
jgi:hypothetical protein